MLGRVSVSAAYSQCHLRQLLLGQVQGVVEGPHPKVAGLLPWRQVGSEDAVVDDVDEGPDTVPAFVVEPDLKNKDGDEWQEVLASIPPDAGLTFTLFLVSRPLMKPDKRSRNRSAAAP